MRAMTTFMTLCMVTRKPAGRAMRDRKQVVKYTVLDSSDDDDESIMTPDNDDDDDSDF